MTKPYRPKLQIKELSRGDFKIVDSDNDNNQLATILTFDSFKTDLPVKETREFIEYLVKFYNENH